VFTVSDWVDSQREFFWDDLARILLMTSELPERLDIEINGNKQTWDLSGCSRLELADSSYQPATMWDMEMADNPTPRHRAYRELASKLRDEDANIRKRVLSELCEWAGVTHDGRKEYRTLTVNELRRLEAGGLIEVGAHTKTHNRLSKLASAAQQKEILHSKEQLTDLLGHPITSFSYPFGGRDDYNDTTIELIKEAGFACACSNFRGCVHRWSDPFQLPRSLVRDWDGKEFKRRLQLFFDS
jgi:peptidoglycan/xylan/chitin deacetylase (PgdA/CDA1 family)